MGYIGASSSSTYGNKRAESPEIYGFRFEELELVDMEQYFPIKLLGIC
jgi:hypothetical protein